jgi:hypothetical protein
VQAGIQGAMEGYKAVDKKAIGEVHEAVTVLKEALNALQTASGALSATAATEKPSPGLSLTALLVSLAVFGVILLGGFWLIQRASTTDPVVAFYSHLSQGEQAQIWRILPPEAQATINRYYQQGKQ